MTYVTTFENKTILRESTFNLEVLPTVAYISELNNSSSKWLNC